MKTPIITNEDYHNFSQEAIQKALTELIEETQRATGATDEQMSEALSEAAKKIMNTNFLKEPKQDEPTFIWYCDKCGYEVTWEIAKLSHSTFGFYDCLACNVKGGERRPFTSSSCPGCGENK